DRSLGAAAAQDDRQAEGGGVERKVVAEEAALADQKIEGIEDEGAEVGVLPAAGHGARVEGTAGPIEVGGVRVCGPDGAGDGKVDGVGQREAGQGGDGEERERL